MSRRVFVSNIPVRMCVDGWVVLPDADDKLTPDDGEFHEAIAQALRSDGFKLARETYAFRARDEELDLDRAALDAGWEFDTPEEKR
jgi:hypothetical protein